MTCLIVSVVKVCQPPLHVTRSGHNRAHHRLVGDPTVSYSRNNKWYKIEWSEFHFVLIFGLLGFVIFWTFLLMR